MPAVVEPGGRHVRMAEPLPHFPKWVPRSAALVAAVARNARWFEAVAAARERLDLPTAKAVTDRYSVDPITLDVYQKYRSARILTPV
jgi:hypothetical protein